MDFSIEWNAENQLTRVTKNTVEQARFKYDPLGRRVEKVAGSTTTNWTYDAEDILREANGSTTLKYIHGQGIDEPLAMDDGSALSYFQADALGSVTKTTSATRAVTATRQYDAWGNVQVGGTSGYAFTGREWDPESGIHYYRARYYDPKIARFISEDPAFGNAGQETFLDEQFEMANFDPRPRSPGLMIDGLGDQQDMHRYAYTGNNPVNFIDPDGQFRRPPTWPIRVIRCSWEYFQCTSKVRKRCREQCGDNPAGERRCVTDPGGYECCRENYYLCMSAIPFDKRPRRKCF